MGRDAESVAWQHFTTVLIKILISLRTSTTPLRIPVSTTHCTSHLNSYSPSETHAFHNHCPSAGRRSTRLIKTRFPPRHLGVFEFVLITNLKLVSHHKFLSFPGAHFLKSDKVISVRLSCLQNLEMVKAIWDR